MLFHRNVFQNDQESLRWNRNDNISYIQGFMQILYNVLYFLGFFCVNFLSKNFPDPDRPYRTSLDNLKTVRPLGGGLP